jgi:hypothetical protein
MTKFSIKLALPAALATLIAVPASAAAAPIDVTAFWVSPSCVKPGSWLTTGLTLKNEENSPVQFATTSWETLFGYTVSSGPVQGPLTAPSGSTTNETQTSQVAWSTPWATYTVHFGVGPDTSSPTSWSQATAQLTVSPFC